MSNYYPHLHPNIREIVDKSNDERLEWVNEPRWIGYPDANNALDKLEDLLSQKRRARMPNVLVVSRTNNGKTDLVRRFHKKHPLDENPVGEHIIAPVVFVETPPSPSEADLYGAILGSLYERVPSGSTGKKRERAIEVLSQIETKVLILDELHNMLAGSSLRQQQFLNVIKYLTNRLSMSIVGVGTKELISAISVDEQIENRFEPIILPRWSYNSGFRRLLKSFEALLPLREPSDLHQTEIARKILAMSEGTIGEISSLLNKAAKYAILNGDERITAEILNSCSYTPSSERSKLISMI